MTFKNGFSFTRILFVSLFSSALLCASYVHAHHSNAAYNVANTQTVSGVVTKLDWRNPHVIIQMDVTDESGKTENWALETAGIQDLVEDGWSKELLAPGEKISAEIRPTKTGKPGGILRWVTLADGRVLPIDPESPVSGQVVATNHTSSTNAPALSLQDKAAKSLDAYLANRTEMAKWEASNRPAKLPLQDPAGNKGALDPDNLAANAGKAVFDFTGVWSHRSNPERAKALGGMAWDFLPVPELTAKSKAIHEDVMARRAAGDATADPATLCYPHGLVRSMTRVGNMMLLQQNTGLFMVHRMNNDYRAIYWDGRDHVDPNIRVDSYNGDSIAYWEKDHLYVETIGFGQPFTYINSGIPIGPQGKIEERWRLINDGNTIEIEFRMTDPEHWVGEWVDTKYWDRIYGADIAEANCIAAEDGVLAIGAGAR